MPMPIVSIVRDTDLEAKVVRALDLIGGIEKTVSKGDKVLVKPNMVDGASPETGETVHPEVIFTVVKLAQAAGASRVTIGESPTWKDPSLYHLYERTAKELGAEMINFNEQPFDEVPVKDPVYFKTVRIARALRECDTFINVPTLKTHHLVGLTVAMKNYYGVIPREDKWNYHKLDRLEEVLVDLNQARPTDLVVVDGTLSTHHIPPFEKHQLDLCIAGRDAVAVDAVSAKVIGVEPSSLRFLKWAEEKHLGVADLSGIEVRGLSIQEAYRKNTATSIDLVHQRIKWIRLVNAGACAGCYGRVATGMFRYHKQGEAELEPIYVLMGPEAKMPRGTDRTVLCGNCTAPTFYNGLRGIHVPGCPPNLEELRKALAALGAPEPGRWWSD